MTDKHTPNSELPELHVDLLRGRASFEKFLAFVFDHPVVPDGRDEKEWYWRHDLDVKIDPHRQVKQMTRLFREPQAILHYTSGQIEQGLWFMFICGEEWFRDPLWAPEVPWPEREGCILAIPYLYSDLFEHQAIGLAPGMLWDLLAHGFDAYPGRPPQYAGENEHVRDAMFRALRTMLHSSNADTQKAALHGLFHVEHPEGAGVIRSWLETAPSLEDKTREYAQSVLAGRAM
jgi:hypothetical protein